MTWIGRVLVLLLLPVGAATAADCPARWPTGTFLQPLLEQEGLGVSDWRHRFAEMRGAGLDELILQWTSADDLPLHGPRGTPILERIVDAARAEGVGLWIGLDHDPGFWEAIAGPATELETYLAKRSRALRDRLPTLVAALAMERSDVRRIIRGWYITDEIDDLHWRDDDKKRLLKAYLTRKARFLRAAAPALPIVISGFSRGELPPRLWAAFWAELLPATGINGLLFQDGVGAGLLGIHELPHYLPPLDDALHAAGLDLRVIVEVFQARTERPGPEGFVAGHASRITRQLAVAAAYTSDPPLLFAQPHYMSRAAGPEAERLLTDYQALRRSCLNG